MPQALSLDRTTELVYRYRHFKPSCNEQKSEPEQIICDGRLWCSSPSGFNDPYDCQPHYRFSDLSVEEARERCLKIIRRNGILEDGPQAYAMMRKAGGGYWNSGEFRNNMLAGIKRTVSESSVLCFNRTWDDPRMWAQYANSGTGYCLEFELDESWVSSEGYFPDEVEYVADRPVVDLSVDFLEDGETALRQAVGILLTKSNHWRDEREVRLVRPGIGPSYFEYPQNSLKRIFLGINISKRNRSRIVRAVKRRAVPVEVYQLGRHATDYTFEASRIA